MKVPGWVCRGSPKMLSTRAAALQHQVAMLKAAGLSIHLTADASRLSCLGLLSLDAHSWLPQQPLWLCRAE